MLLRGNIITQGMTVARIYKKHDSEFKTKVSLEAIKEQKMLGELSQQYSIFVFKGAIYELKPWFS